MSWRGGVETLGILILDIGGERCHIQEKQRSTDQHHVPEKQMIFRLVFAISRFCVGRKLVLGTERSLVIGIAGGVIAAGILSTLLIFFLEVAKMLFKVL
jgi:hypothetical protein